MDILEASIAQLTAFQGISNSRGRFIATYLGLRRMGEFMAPLGSEEYTTIAEIQSFLDRMWTKTNRTQPLVVLTAPFGGSTGVNAGYSTLSGATAPGNTGATNSWRNNLNTQKGVGCVAKAELIPVLLEGTDPRMSCPHMRYVDDADYVGYVCGVNGTKYRGEQHSIWLRRDETMGYQAVDLDVPSVWETYLRPQGWRIPIFPLIGALYSMAPADFYPLRSVVGIPEFAADFSFDISAVETIFNCDPADPMNAQILSLAGFDVEESPAAPATESPSLPELRKAILLNSGVGAELAVAQALVREGWTVFYTGNQMLLGYDLRAEREGVLIRVEVKSSVGFVTPTLTQSEWDAAINYGDTYVLSIVDFYGSPKQEIWFVRDPAEGIEPSVIVTSTYRIARGAVQAIKTDVDFL